MAVKSYSMKTDKNLKLSNNFTVREFACNDGSDQVLIDSDLVEILQNIRDYFGMPVIINSGYRTIAYNESVGGSSSSQHCKGTAVDIKIKGINPLRIALYAASLPFYSSRGGIGLYSRSSGTTDGFVHIDTRATYSRWTSKVGTVYLTVSKIMPTLKEGSKDGSSGIGYSVTILQRHLDVAVDGQFGENTKTALINWQKDHGLVADGIAGTKTWNSF